MSRSKKSLAPVTPLAISPRPSDSVRQAVIKSAYSPKLRVQLVCREGSGRTRQSFKDECDINNIMSRFQRTGVLDFVNRREPQYVDCTGLDYQRAQDLVLQAKAMFAELPSSLRSRFENDPARFLDFCQDPENQDELVKLGLAEKRVVAPQGAPPAPEGPAGPKPAPGGAPGPSEAPGT